MPSSDSDAVIPYSRVPDGAGTFRYREALNAALADFIREIKPRLDGTGEPEAQLSGPIEQVFKSVVTSLGLDLVIYGQSHLPEFGVKPDFALKVAGSLAGYVELKRPGKGADPTQWSPRSHDGRQWQRLKILPNVLYTDGYEWALYRTGARVGDIGRLPQISRGKSPILRSFDFSDVGRIIHNFVLWEPSAPRTLDQLVRSIAGLCQLLRDEVREALKSEKAGERTRLFSLLAEDWRNILFPDSSDESFADGYAQTVTFALLLARVEGIDFNNRNISEIARLLGHRRALMGKALGVLTDEFVGKFDVAVDTLVRVISAVDWRKIDDGTGQAYYRLYEPFLTMYDSKLRQKTGSYYTPPQIVSFMVGFVDNILKSNFDRDRGFASPDVVVVDPAMGTGTFLTEVVKHVAKTIEEEEGVGAVPAQLKSLTKRLIGLEKQIGPFAVAEWRMHAALKEEGGVSARGLRLYAADTLANPYVKETRLPAGYEPIAKSLRAANRMKRDEPVMVVIGNPPYGDKAGGLGGWVESGDSAAMQPSLLEQFRAEGNGRYESVLSSLGIYFWRWATWKVFDAHPDAPSGVVAFITTSRYTSGPGFAGMREYLRRNANEGWIIDLSPEGHRPPANTRVFRGVQQPLCIGIFVRRGKPDVLSSAKVHYLAVEGDLHTKFDRLSNLGLETGGWQECAEEWQAPFAPKFDDQWTQFPALKNTMPWSSRGVTTGHTWIHAPDKDVLSDRWEILMGSATDRRRELFGESPQLGIDAIADPLPGVSASRRSIASENGRHLEPVVYGFRSFDRQWIIPDNRLMARSRPPLWAVRSNKQVYLTELHSEPPTNGPPITFTAHVPDIHHYRGSGAGRAIPLYRDSAGTDPNFAPRLIEFLSRALGLSINEHDLLAYIAGTVCHGGYTEKFSRSLSSGGGVRVPLSYDPELWDSAKRIGREVLWLHTFGERYAAEYSGSQSLILPPKDRPRVVRAIPDDEMGMPRDIEYDFGQQLIRIGDGEIRPVLPAVWEYKVGSMQVIKKWFGYRKKEPAGKRSTPLDSVHTREWSSTSTTRLLELINVLTRVVELELAQATLLNAICGSQQITDSDLASAQIFPTRPERGRAPRVGGTDGGQGTLI
ncbi:type ISP restriction/modification enzyme [Actinoplanes sp. NPDC049596]|uniref:type ISP restriction/modification enzyme n=1 Tax=unclassified Actinoplanes TaxID=2626549 RepID=UPI0034179415